MKLRTSLVLTVFAVMAMGTSLAQAAHPLYKSLPKVEDQLPQYNELIVAYYGRPGVKALGVLGSTLSENSKNS